MSFRDYNYIFVVTYARSGSTLIQSLLNSLDGVQIRGENNNALFYLYQAFSGVKMTAKLGRWGRESEPDQPWYGAGEMKPIGFQNASLNALVRNVLCPTDGISVLGFKEIRYTPFFMTDKQFKDYMDFLLGAFPGAKIVFNTRKADDVAKSAWLAKEKPGKVKDWVNRCDERFAQCNASSDQTILMHYNDYVVDRSKIAELYTFLGFDFDLDVVNAIFSKPLKHAK